MEDTQPVIRTSGVTANGIIALLGSLLTLAICVLMVLSFSFTASRAAMPEQARLGLMVFVGIFAALGIWGTTTAIGLFRVRNWARISIVVFGVLLALTGLVSGPTILIIPAPPTAPAGFGTVRIILAVFYGALGLLGVFWVYYFCRRATRDVFGAMVVPQSGGRPLSISIIGWWFLLSGIFCVLLSPLRMPAALFIWLVIGWGAVAWYLVAGSIYALCGYGLLRLKPAARQGTIALLVLGLMNGAIFFGAPGSETRMDALMSNSRFGTQAPPFPHFTPFILIPTTLAILVPLWFLIVKRQAFYRSDFPS